MTPTLQYLEIPERATRLLVDLVREQQAQHAYGISELTRLSSENGPLDPLVVADLLDHPGFNVRHNALQMIQKAGSKAKPLMPRLRELQNDPLGTIASQAEAIADSLGGE